jgi:DeoR/GlpR family transcriptional regulator of sugar metabolism
MNIKDRETEILNTLRERREATVRELSSQLYVSEPTMRRALASLEKSGMIIRTHGGAIYKGEIGENLPLSYREREHSEAKRIIALKCLDLISDGDTIMVDGSSSALALLKILKKKNNIVVITNSAVASPILVENGIKTFVTGGELSHDSICYTGAYAERFIDEFSADLCFFSVRTLSTDGRLTDNAISENAIRKRMIKSSKRSVLMLDSKKISDPCLNTLCMIDDISLVVSERDISHLYPSFKDKFL